MTQARTKTKESAAAILPGDMIQQWPLDRLIPYARNPRKNDHAVTRMVGVIKEFGFKLPVLVRSDGTVVDGHLRLKAAAVLALKSVPVILCDEWSEAQVKAFRLVVNRSVAWAEWDDELLGLELSELQEMELDLSLTGFESDEIDKYIQAATASQPDAPDAFKQYDEAIDTEHVCPRCAYRWSGGKTVPVTEAANESFS